MDFSCHKIYLVGNLPRIKSILGENTRFYSLISYLILHKKICTLSYHNRIRQYYGSITAVLRQYSSQKSVLHTVNPYNAASLTFENLYIDNVMTYQCPGKFLLHSQVLAINVLSKLEVTHRVFVTTEDSLQQGQPLAPSVTLAQLSRHVTLQIQSFH